MRLTGSPRAGYKSSACECNLSVSLFFIKSTLEVIFSGSPRPFDEISEDRRTHTLTLEHLVPKSLSNMALLKYYGCFLFFKCLQMYPAKAPFQVLKQSQKALFIFTFVHRQKNSRAVNLLSTSCPHSERCPPPYCCCVYWAGFTCVPTYSNPSFTVLCCQKVVIGGETCTRVLDCFLVVSDYKAKKAKSSSN